VASRRLQQHAGTINFKTKGVDIGTASLTIKNDLNMEFATSVLKINSIGIVVAVQLHLELKKLRNNLAALKILLTITLVDQIDRK